MTKRKYIFRKKKWQKRKNQFRDRTFLTFFIKTVKKTQMFNVT